MNKPRRYCLKPKWFKAIDSNLNNYYSTDIVEFAKEFNLNATILKACLDEKVVKHKGWMFFYV